MAYGEIHSSTGTICKAKSDASCPLSTGGHSKSADEFIDNISAVEGLDRDKFRSMVADGTPLTDALSVLREGGADHPAIQGSKRRVPAYTPAMAGYDMTNDVFDAARGHEGSLYYDLQGNVYKVERNDYFRSGKSFGTEPVLVPLPGQDVTEPFTVRDFFQGSRFRRLKPSEFHFRKPAPSAAIGSYVMTDEKLDIHRVYPGQRFYDSEGGAYIVETAQRGQFATLNPIGADGTVPRPKPGADGELRVTADPRSSNHLRLLEAPQDARYTNGVAGESESKAIRSLPAEGHWPRSVSGVVNFRDENGNQKSIELVAPAERLTDKKRIELGKQLWSFTGQDPKRFEDATDEQKLQWANQRIMRRQDYKWRTNEDGSVSYSHQHGSGGSHDGKDIKLVEL